MGKVRDVTFCGAVLSGLTFHEEEEDKGDGKETAQDKPEKDILSFGLSGKPADKPSDHHNNQDHENTLSVFSGGRTRLSLPSGLECGAAHNTWTSKIHDF